MYNSANVTVQSAQPGTGSGLTWSSLAAGNGYYVIGTNGTTLCVSPNSNAVNVSTYPNTTPTITGSASVCINSTDTYTTQSGMNSYIWSVSGGSITSGGTSTDATVTITCTMQGAESVSVNYTDGNGCTAAAPYVYTVTVNALPIPTITGNNTVCLNSTNTYTTQSGMSDYVWTVSSGGTINGSATDNTVSITWNNSGSQSVSVNYTNPTTGCTAATATVYDVTVNIILVPSITGKDSVCLNSTNTYTTQSGMSDYIWKVSSSGSINGSATNSTVSVTWNATGPGSVSVNYTDPTTGCTAASPTVYNVTVNPLPVPSISGYTPVCVNATRTYTTQTGMSGYTWTVSSGGTINGSATDNTVSITWNNSGSQSVSVNYADLNGCYAAVPTVFPVTVDPLPVPTVSGPGTVCDGSSGNVYTTQIGMTSYIWTVTGGTITAGNGTYAIVVTWTTPGSQTVGVSYTNGNGCTSASPGSKTVTVIALPVPTITGPTSICKGSTGVIYSTESGMSNYNWSISVGGSITAGAGTDSVTVTWSTSGSQNISVTYDNTYGCDAASPTVYPVTVNPLPSPTITGPASVR